MEAVKTNSSSNNKSNSNKDPGIYTCPTCNALFTCLKFYQQHVTQHAESNGNKLFCCSICRYSTEDIFHHNWHQMSHKNAPAHSCSVCQDKSTDDSYSNNHLNGRQSDNTVSSSSKNSRKAQQNGNSNKKIKYNNNKAFVKQEVQQEEEDTDEDDDDEDEEDSDADSDQEESEESEEADNEEEEDEDESGESEDEEDDEEEEIDEEIDQSQVATANYQQQNKSAGNNQLIDPDEQDEISDDDEDDDEEEEIESEEDNGENSELPEEYLVAQRLNNNDSGYNYDMQTNQNAHGLNNNSAGSNNLANNQGPPYIKSEIGLPSLINDGIICNKGRGKGNRKSRTINQMGGQLDDEMSQAKRKFHCAHCQKSFKTKSHLQRHILTHTGEKPYHCNRCGAKFNQSSSLRNHIIALHTKEYPHFCNHCNKGFLMPALLQKHMQTSHRDQPE